MRRIPISIVILFQRNKSVGFEIKGQRQNIFGRFYILWYSILFQRNKSVGFEIKGQRRNIFERSYSLLYLISFRMPDADKCELFHD